MSEYRVELDAYNGPLDLLLFLIRRDEVDVYDIPIADITTQYAGYVELLKTLEPNVAGDYVLMLATLIEIKSRAMLPRVEAIDGDEEDPTDPRLELVRQLLAYKAFKDAAQELELSVQVQSLKFPRQPVEIGSEGADEVDLEDLNIWSLMTAFSKLLEQTGRAKPYHEVVFDDTPIALHAADIVDSLQRNNGSQLFETIFAGRSKAEMIGLFLAMLELVRNSRIRLTQEESFGSITVHLVDATPLDSLDDSETVPEDAN
jgi:segregation and condensation protein A